MIDVEDFELRQLYEDILKGVSSFEFEGARLYIKHIGLLDQASFDKKHWEFYNSALASKLPKEKEKLKELELKKLWLPSDESWVETNQLTLNNLKKNKDGALPSQAKEFDREIEKITEEINLKLDKKYSLLGVTADAWANQKYNEYYLRATLFKDEFLKESYFPEDYDEDDLEKVSAAYVECSNKLSLESIKKLTCSYFFQSNFNIADTVLEFFGKPSYVLTYFQVRLYRQAQEFKRIYSQGLPPPDITHPDKIIEWFNNKDKVPEATYTPAPTQPDPENSQKIENLVGDKKVVRGEEAIKLAKQFFS